MKDFKFHKAFQFLLLQTLICISLSQDLKTPANPGKVQYDGYKVFRLVLKTEDHIEVLKLLRNYKVPFWGLSTAEIGGITNVMLAPHQIGYILEGLIDSGIEVSELHSDVQKLFDSQAAIRKPDGMLSWESYDRLEDIYTFLRNQADNSTSAAKDPNGLRRTVGSLGRSVEGREILYIKISSDSSTPKRSILIDSNMHAREWITSAVSTYLINELINNQNDTEIQGWTKDFDWYIIPVVNPDGFEYSHTHNRLWRKNRSKSKPGKALSCRGVDLNRNFGFHWNETGTSGDPCSDWYSGPSAFSEPESKAFEQFVNHTINSGSENNTIGAYISLHSFSQLILLPYSFMKKGERFPQYETYMKIANAAALEHSKLYGTKFRVGTIPDLLYPASGCSFDWFKGVHNVPLSLTYELRDTGHFSTFLPPDQIIPSALEFIAGLKGYIRELRRGIPNKDAL